MANVQLDAGQLIAKVREQGAKIAELELIRDAYDGALNEANARIAELEAQIPTDALVEGRPALDPGPVPDDAVPQ